jgi:hypothetical protein
MADKNYKRKKVVVLPSFQVRYTILLVTVALLVCSVLGVLYVETLKEQTRILTAKTSVIGGDKKDEEFAKDLEEKTYESEDSKKIVGLVVASFVLCLILAFVGIRSTFKAAGPIYAVSRTLRAVAMGKMDAFRHFRKGDDFRFLEEDLMAVRDFLKKEARADADFLNRVTEIIRSLPIAQDKADRAVIDELVCDIQEYAKAKIERF